MPQVDRKQLMKRSFTGCTPAALFGIILFILVRIQIVILGGGHTLIEISHSNHPVPSSTTSWVTARSHDNGWRQEELFLMNVSSSIELPTHTLYDGTNISWIGNNWFPPPNDDDDGGGTTSSSRPYTRLEMQSVFRQHSMLWIGDSTIRRAYATLYSILNHSSLDDDPIPTTDVDSPIVLDVSKDEVHSIDEEAACTINWGSITKQSNNALCRTMPHSSISSAKQFDFVTARCIQNVIELLEAFSSNPELLRPYSVLMIGTGTWDIAPHKRSVCIGRKRFPNHVFDLSDRLLVLLEKLATKTPQVKLLWRTTPLNQHDLEHDVIDSINEKFRGGGQSTNYVIIDFDRAIRPRSVGEDRIAGNNIYHFGLSARLLFTQMVLNYLLLSEI